MHKHINQSIVFYVIMLVAMIMRLYHFDAFSLTNDELSAVYRSMYDSFSEMVQKGIIATDPHPAGVQVFMFYWIKIFGKDVFWVRLPFVLFSIGSVYLSYLVSRRWFGVLNALMVMALIATLEFAITYGQIARPYSVGFFFGLLTVYCWGGIMESSSNKQFWKYVAAYILSASACAYTHYFSGLFAFSVGIAGLLVVDKSRWLKYLLANVAVALLFIPHWTITSHQMKVGGLSGWLPKPDLSFFTDHLFFIFNSSYWVVSIVILSMGFIALYGKFFTKWSKYRWVVLFWFLFPLIVGYIYSINFETVLMDRVLLFTFPYLIMFLFSSIKPIELNAKFLTLPLLLLVVGAGSTAFEKKFYSTAHFEDFELLANRIETWDKKYGAQRITHTINLNSPNYINYYLEKLNHEVDFKIYQTIGGDQIPALKSIIEASSTDFFISGWACIHHPPIIDELIKRKYPVLVDSSTSFNTSIKLYQRGDEASRKVLVDEVMDFEAIDINGWNVDSTYMDTNMVYDGRFSYRVESSMEFAVTYESTASSMVEAGTNVISIAAQILAEDTIKGMWVVSVERGDETIGWYSSPASTFITGSNEWVEFFMSTNLPLDMKPEDRIKIYYWNSDRKKFWLDNVHISSYEDSKVNY